MSSVLIPPTANASTFCWHPRFVSSYARLNVSARFETTEPQMKRSLRGTDDAATAFAKPRWLPASTEAKKLR